MHPYETKPKTLRNIEIATSRTGSLMERLGAKVSVISLPGPTKGVDDFIKDQGPLAYEKLDCEALRLRDWREGFNRLTQTCPPVNQDLATMERRDKEKGAAVNKDLSTPTSNPNTRLPLSPRDNLLPTNKSNTRVDKFEIVGCRGNKEQHPALEQSENLSLTTNLCKSGQPLNLTNPLCTDRPSIEGCPDLHILSRRPQERKERLRVKEAKQSSANGSLVGKPEQTSVAQQVIGIEAVNQLNDRDFMLLQQSVMDYFNASPPQPPPTTDKQLVQAEVDRLVTQINRLWTKQASQMALVNKMQKNPFRAWDKRYEKAVAAVEKTMAMITQSIT